MERTEELIQRSQEGDKEAREILIEENMGLIHHVVKRFLGRGVEAEDLFQIGAIGLVKAVDRFDLSFGVRFSTYAVPMIAGEIKRFLQYDQDQPLLKGAGDQGFQTSGAAFDGAGRGAGARGAGSLP